jgi:hypothetical protein
MEMVKTTEVYLLMLATTCLEANTIFREIS